MKKNIETTEHGLKCDNPECDWINNSIKIKDYKSWLNKPCPKCGENVLTEADYRNVLVVMSVVECINTLELSANDDIDTSGTITMIVDTHEKIKIKEIKLTE